MLCYESLLKKFSNHVHIAISMDWQAVLYLADSTCNHIYKGTDHRATITPPALLTWWRWAIALKRWVCPAWKIPRATPVFSVRMLTKNLFITTALQVESTDWLKITKNTTFRREADFGLPPFLPEDDTNCDNDH
jgi:hypothetical protein